MKSVLFVDDDRNVLSGLRDLLRSHRREWDMEFINSGEEALALLATRSFDVVVSDMRMPKVDGSMLLTETKRQHPRTVRIVLSGQTEMELAMKTVAIAHQFLSKPCDAEQLQEVIRRACNLNEMLNDDGHRSLVGGIDSLPSVPGTYVKLTEVLAGPSASIKDVADIIERDVAMCAKLLQIVNSAFFGLPRRISNVLEAATYLGTLMIRNLALSMGTFSTFNSSDPKVIASLEKLRRHSILTANIVRTMFKDRRKAEDCFMAGMLHDVGHLILLTTPRVALSPGVDPALLGAYLLGLWGIPYPIVEGVAYHERPAELEHRKFDIPDAVHIAHRLASSFADVPGHDPTVTTRIDPDYLRALGITDGQMNDWRALAQKMARDSSS